MLFALSSNQHDIMMAVVMISFNGEFLCKTSSMFVFATVRFMEIPCFDTEYRETACLENGNYRVSVM